MSLFFFILLIIISSMSAFFRHHNPKFVSRKQKLWVASSEESLKDILILFTDKITNMLTIQKSEIKEELKNVKDEMMDELKYVKDEMMEELKYVKDEMMDVKQDLRYVKEELNNIVDTYGIKWEQASDTYEIMARTQIRKRFPNAKVVSCQSLNQLAEICLPNDYNFESAQEFTDKDKIGALPVAAVSKRAQLLMKIARKQIPLLRLWMESKEDTIEIDKKQEGKDKQKQKRNQTLDNLERKVNMLRRELKDYDRCNGKSEYLRTGRLGFFAYSTLLIANQSESGFIEELEIDFLRQPTLVIDKITHFAGDVKFGKARKDAMVQALRRVGVFYMAGKHVLGKKHKEFMFEGYGQIASPRDWRNPTRVEIDALKGAAGILEYPPKLYIVMEKYFGVED